VRVWSVGDREFVLGGVWGGDGESVRDGDVRVLLGDGGGGGEECGEIVPGLSGIRSFT